MDEAMKPLPPTLRPGRYIDEETLRRRREQESYHRRNRGKEKDQPLTEQETRLLARFSRKETRGDPHADRDVADQEQRPVLDHL